MDVKVLTDHLDSLLLADVKHVFYHHGPQHETQINVQ